MKTILHGMAPIQIIGGDGKYYLIPAMMLGGSQATAPTFPFELYLDDNGDVAVNYGEVDGVPPSGMDANNPYVLQNADGDIFLHLTFDGATRELTSSFITWGVDATNTETDKYIAIGSVSSTTDSSGNITYSIEQYLATSVYTDQALYVSDNENTFYADENSVFVGDSSTSSVLDSNSLVLTDTEGSASVTLDIPDNNGTVLNASWQEIEVCVSGQTMRMKVLGTQPYPY
jgi:hypothetical protein